MPNDPNLVHGYKRHHDVVGGPATYNEIECFCGDVFIDKTPALVDAKMQAHLQLARATDQYATELLAEEEDALIGTRLLDGQRGHIRVD